MEEIKNERIDDLQFKPMLFNSGKFVLHSLNWTIPEKEMYPIFHISRRFNYLLETHRTGILLLTDHNNLVHVLTPSEKVKKTSLGRLGRWALELQSIPYEVKHLPGDQNLLADMLSRWGYLCPPLTDKDVIPVAEYSTVNERDLKVNRLKIINGLDDAELRKIIETNVNEPEVVDAFAATPAIGILKAAIRETDDIQEEIFRRISFLNPILKNRKWDPISWERIASEQRRARKAKRKTLKRNTKTNCYEDEKGRTWIPTAIVDLLLIQQHHLMNHSSEEVEFKNFQSKYFLTLPWTSLRERLKNLREVCLHCERYPFIIRRPIGQIQPAKGPNQILYADYLYIAEKGYLLVIVDDFTRRISLSLTPSCESVTVAKALLRWKRTVGLPEDFVLVTDRGSQFTSLLMLKLDDVLKIKHNFSIAYAAWTNGSAEVTNKVVLKNLRSLASVYNETDWKDLIDLVEVYVNNRPNPEKLHLSPNQLLVGKRNAGGQEVYSQGKTPPLITTVGDIIQQESIEITEYLQDLSTELQRIDKRVFELVERKRDRMRKSINKRIKVANL